MQIGIPRIQPIVNVYARAKIYTQRMTHYLGLFRTAGIAILIFQGYDIPLWVAITGFVVMIIAMMGLGWCEDRIGVIKEEQRIYTERNPLIIKVLEELQELRKEIGKR